MNIGQCRCDEGKEGTREILGGGTSARKERSNPRVQTASTLAQLQPRSLFLSPVPTRKGGKRERTLKFCGGKSCMEKGGSGVKGEESRKASHTNENVG